jgi:hypothetical protein
METTTNKQKFGKVYLMMSGTLFMAGLAVLAGNAFKVNKSALTLVAIAGLTFGGYYSAKLLENK